MASFGFPRTFIAAQAIFLSASLCAQQPAPKDAVPPAARTAAAGQEQSKTILFEGTAVRLKFTQEVSSATAQVGDAVNFDTVEDVRLGEVVVIPKGSHALGKVAAVTPKRHMGRAGKLDISVEFVRMSSGEKLPLSGSPEKSGKGHQGRMAGAMVATSIIIWPAAPFFLFMHGKDIVIPVGQEVSVYTADDYDITKAKVADAPSVAPAAASPAAAPASPATAPPFSPAPPGPVAPADPHP